MTTVKGVLATARHILVTPVSCDRNALSRIDYEREMGHEEKGFAPTWDDIQNHTKVGDLFAFVIGHGRPLKTLESEGTPGGTCQIRRVENVLSPAHRPECWHGWDRPVDPKSTVLDHPLRNVLVLGPTLANGSYVELMTLLGKKATAVNRGVLKASPLQAALLLKIRAVV